ncbi:hypothetical protein FHG87_023572 [Trinorchestia longiramus]|nr:hypothetical protein FHG87_023572 [Trinorchestia longiramus]
MIQCMTCILWVDMELCKGLSEVNDSNLRKFVFDCWKRMADGKLGRLVSESAFERKDPGSNPVADMVDTARNTAWDLAIDYVLVKDKAKRHVDEMYVDENEFDIDTNHQMLVLKYKGRSVAVRQDYTVLLFDSYTEELAICLRMSGLGLKVEEEKPTCLPYADNIVMAQTVLLQVARVSKYLWKRDLTSVRKSPFESMVISSANMISCTPSTTERQRSPANRPIKRGCNALHDGLSTKRFQSQYLHKNSHHLKNSTYSQQQGEGRRNHPSCLRTGWTDDQTPAFNCLFSYWVPQWSLTPSDAHSESNKDIKCLLGDERCLRVGTEE